MSEHGFSIVGVRLRIALPFPRAARLGGLALTLHSCLHLRCAATQPVSCCMLYVSRRTRASDGAPPIEMPSGAHARAYAARQVCRDCVGRSLRVPSVASRGGDGLEVQRSAGSGGARRVRVVSPLAAGAFGRACMRARERESECAVPTAMLASWSAGGAAATSAPQDGTALGSRHRSRG